MHTFKSKANKYLVLSLAVFVDTSWFLVEGTVHLYLIGLIAIQFFSCKELLLLAYESSAKQFGSDVAASSLCLGWG